MNFKWKPYVYPNLIIDYFDNNYLIFNPDFVNWVIIDSQEYLLFSELQADKNIDDIIKLWNEQEGISISSLEKKLKILLGKLRMRNIIFSSPPVKNDQDQKVVQQYSLQIAYLGLTKACNLSCPFCYAEAGKSYENELTVDEFKEVIDDIAYLGASKIIFTGGEPFLRKEIFDLSKYAKSKGLITGVISNGTLINESNIANIVQSFDDVSISLDGSKKDIHEKVRGRGNFELTMNAIELLSKAGIKMGINSVITKFNYQDITNLNRLASTYSSDMHNIFMYLPLGRGSRNDLSCDIQQLKEMRQQMLESLKTHREEKYVVNRIENAPPKRGWSRNGCGAARTEIFVDSHGDLYPCRLLETDSLKLGNIRNIPLRDLYYKSESLNKCRLTNVEQIDDCKDCSYKKVCAGSCRAMHFAYSGDFYKNENWICDLLKSEILLNLWVKSGIFPKII